MTISGKARVAGVMGWPVAHSLSPRLHNRWLALYGIDGAYVPLAVRPERAAAALRALPDLGFAGCNVTVPHKETAFSIAARHDAAAARLGAVNTIVIAEDGRLEGRNTDGYGFLQALHGAAPGWSGGAGPAVVLGAGGAARAVVAALQDEGVNEIRVLNRTQSRAEALAAALGPAVRAIAWERRHAALEGAALLVNTTTLGMAGGPPLELHLDALPRDAVVDDIVYVPVRTPLLAAAAARGNRTVGGLDMLLHQARPAFAAWYGRDPEVDEALRRYVAEGLPG